MPFPSNIPLVTLHGRILSPGVDSDRPTDAVVARYSRVRLVFTPSVSTVPVPAADPAPLLIHTRGMPRRVEGITDTEGYLCTPDPANPDIGLFRGVRLIPTDLPEYAVQDWTWHVEERSLDGKSLYRAYDIAVPVAAVESGLDLANLVPVPATEGYGIPQAEAAAAAAAQDAQAARETVELGFTDAQVIGDDLILTRANTTTKNAGNVRGIKGDTGASISGATENAGKLTLQLSTGTNLTPVALPASTVPGPSNNLTIGTVTTGPAGSTAAATLTGTSPSQTLNLTIPKGDKGDKGDVGPTYTPADTGWVTIPYAAPATSGTIEYRFRDQTLEIIVDVAGSFPANAATAITAAANAIPTAHRSYKALRGTCYFSTTLQPGLIMANQNDGLIYIVNSNATAATSAKGNGSMRK